MTWLEERSEALDPDSQARLNQPHAHLGFQKQRHSGTAGGCLTLLAALSNASRQRFEEVQHGLTALGIPSKLNPRLVRGLDYYRHIY